MGVEFFANKDDEAAAADFESGDANDHDVLDYDTDIFDKFKDILGDAQNFTEVGAKDWQKKSLYMCIMLHKVSLYLLLSTKWLSELYFHFTR